MEQTTSKDANQQPKTFTSKSVSIYVSNLPKTFNEKHLVDFFSEIGPVESVRIIRDTAFNASQGNGYVNYHDPKHAAQAIKEKNFAQIEGKEIRVMVSQPDATIRKSGIGNLFVKSLDESVDNRQLNELFSPMGNILSSRLATDENGKSLGYGFVQFEKSDNAEKAISTMDGHIHKGKELKVCHFVPKKNRNQGQATFTNVYIKNFVPYYPEEQMLVEAFGKFGEITSHYYPLENDKPKGFAFVNYKEPANAMQAIKEMNDKVPENSAASEELLNSDHPPAPIYVAQALSKAARRIKVEEQMELRRRKKDEETAGRNLFVKNLPETVTSEMLREEFSKIGTVESAEVRYENNISKCFGFVLMSRQEEAADAIKNFNCVNYNGKTLAVTLFQRKSVRQPLLEAQQIEKRRAMYNNNPLQPFYQNPQSMLIGSQMANSFYLNQMNNVQMSQPRYLQMPTQLSGMPMGSRVGPLQQPPAQFNGQRSQNYYRDLQQQQQQQLQMMQQQMAPMASQQMAQQQMAPMSSQQIAPQQMAQSQMTQQQLAQQQSAMSRFSGRFEEEAEPMPDLQNEPDLKQLRDEVYARVMQCHSDPQTVNEITGMFLELDPSTMQNIIENNVLFDQYVNKAVDLLNTQPNDDTDTDRN